MKFLIALLLPLAALFAVPAAAQTADTVKKAVMKVTNLHCDGDMPTIKKQLLNQEGIDDVTFTERAGVTSVFTVTYHSIATDVTRIEQAIETTPGCDEQNETPYRVKRERTKKKY